MHQSGKTYGHEQGFSCAFRQWRADSHCNKLHGYALSFKLIFEADKLDKNGWVVDFGSLKSFKEWLASRFDHRTIVAEDDPDLQWFEAAHMRGVLSLVILPAVGCEKFAQQVYDRARLWLLENDLHDVRVASVTVAEHGANHATYINPLLDITKRGFSNYQPLMVGSQQVAETQIYSEGELITLEEMDKAFPS